MGWRWIELGRVGLGWTELGRMGQGRMGQRKVGLRRMELGRMGLGMGRRSTLVGKVSSSVCSDESGSDRARRVSPLFLFGRRFSFWSSAVRIRLIPVVWEFLTLIISHVVAISVW